MCLDKELGENISKSDLLSNCVYNRLSKILEVQASYFDESLSTIQNALDSIDFSNAYNLKKFNILFKNLHHFMGVDRHRMISYLIKLKNM